MPFVTAAALAKAERLADTWACRLHAAFSQRATKRYIIFTLDTFASQARFICFRAWHILQIERCMRQSSADSIGKMPLRAFPPNVDVWGGLFDGHE